MRFELPVCTRCCLCLPLRRGLITWGYIRLIFSSFVLFGATRSFFKMIDSAKSDPDPDASHKMYAVLFGVLILFTLADIVLNTIFVVGGHRKILKLIRPYYIYSFILWISTALIGFGLASYTVYWFNQRDSTPFYIWVLIVDIATYIAQLVIQAYVLLLVRSEVMKLAKNYEFSFVNNEAESQCAMKSEVEANDS